MEWTMKANFEQRSSGPEISAPRGTAASCRHSRGRRARWSHLQ